MGTAGTDERMDEDGRSTHVGLAAVEALYRTDLRRIVRLAYLLTGDRATAEEVAQDAFLRLIPKMATTRAPAAYLTTVTVNRCRDLGRRDATARRHPWGRAEVADAPTLPREVDEVWLAVQRLPSHHREAVVLRYWADLSTAEVARLLGVRPGTARSQLHRALAALEEALTDAR